MAVQVLMHRMLGMILNAEQVFGMPASDNCVRPPATTASVEAHIRLSAAHQVHQLAHRLVHEPRKL